jgi:UDP-N-acetylmuramate dehydrogenase
MVEQLSVSRDWPADTLRSAFGSGLEFAVELAPYTSFKTGGRAKWFIRARSSEEVARSVRAAQRLKIPYFLLGGGSNVLVSDAGFEGVIIKIDVGGLSLYSQTGVDCGAGEDLMALVKFATENSLTGMEFAAGIWGTAGGAICGNAGAYGSDMGKVVSSVELVEPGGELRTESAEYCRFGYRDSRFKSSGEVIVSARFEFRQGDRATISARVDEILRLREERHPVDSMSAGCFFKNVPDPKQPHGKLAAGKLLEEAGAKDLSFGGARVFEKHANIIVNTGKATSKEIRQLADKMKQRVKDKFRIDLEEEIVCIGEF